MIHCFYLLEGQSNGQKQVFCVFAQYARGYVYGKIGSAMTEKYYITRENETLNENITRFFLGVLLSMLGVCLGKQVRS